MKNITKSVQFSIILSYDTSLPHVISIDGPNGFLGDDIYFSEHDGTAAADWLPEEIIPDGGKLESNGKNEAWISHWNNETLEALDGREFKIRFTQVFEEVDGDMELLKETSEVIPTA